MSDQVVESISCHYRTRLPDKMVQEILIHLPARTIFRFKTLSRTWNLIISSPYFKKSYISRNPTPSWFIVEQSLTRISIPDLLEFTTTHLCFQEPPKLSTLFITLPENVGLLDSYHPTLLASCNGLLLIEIMFRLQSFNLFLITAITNQILPVEIPQWPPDHQMGIGLTTQIGKTNGFCYEWCDLSAHLVCAFMW